MKTSNHCAAIIFSAPQGWGKTLNAEKLKREFGKNEIIDDWWFGEPIKPNALHFTNMHPSEFGDIGCTVIARGWKS